MKTLELHRMEKINGAADAGECLYCGGLNAYILTMTPLGGVTSWVFRNFDPICAPEPWIPL